MAHLDPSTRRLIKWLYYEGRELTPKALALRFGVSDATVRKVIAEGGHKVHGLSCRGHKLTHEQVTGIREGWRLGKALNAKMTHESVGKKFGVSRETIRHILNNVTWRGLGDDAHT